MQQYKPFPLHPLLVGLFQSELNLGSPEEATIPANVRKGFDVMAAKVRYMLLLLLLQVGSPMLYSQQPASA